MCSAPLSLTKRWCRNVAFTAPPDAPPEYKRQGRLSAACQKLFNYLEFLERAKGLEPSTPTLARLGSQFPGLSLVSYAAKNPYFIIISVTQGAIWYSEIS